MEAAWQVWYLQLLDVSVFKLDVDDVLTAPHKRVQDVWVELSPSVLVQNLKAFRKRIRFFVGASACKCVEDIGYSRDATFEWNVLAGKTQRIARFVPPFVVGECDSSCSKRP